MTENTKQDGKTKLEALRTQLKDKELDGYLVPKADEFQGEYITKSAERLAWLTGFTGSAGMAAILTDKAAVFSDGRYTVQIKKQVDEQLFETYTEKLPKDWISDHISVGMTIGYDPMLHTVDGIKAIEKALRAKKAKLMPVEGNLVDAVWSDRPAFPDSTIELFSDDIAGKTAAEKRAEIAEAVKKAGGKAVILTKPESVGWLLNVRAHDIPCAPLPLSYAIVHESGEVDWFINPNRVHSDILKHLGTGVRLCRPNELKSALETLAVNAKAEEKPLLIDPKLTPVWFKETLESTGAETEEIDDPVAKPRACKTPSEQKAIIDAHVTDGVAMTRFLKWISDEAPKGKLTEMDIVTRLKEFRAMEPSFVEPSFDTIAGWADNGAVVHYNVNDDPENAKAIKGSGILLIDSGGQYPGGTTDITRTVAVGKPSDDMKKHFTLVLKGHIAIATGQFPEGTKGEHIDSWARKALWDHGLDYDHSTGHGVGCYLSVHETASNITKGKSAMSIKPGMLISNEPGFYKEGAYGIRIESLVLAQEFGKRAHAGRDVKMLNFKTVTMAPIDRNLINSSLLDDKELQWLNDYHEEVYQTLKDRLEPDVAKWLREQTQPLKKNLKSEKNKNWFPGCRR